jgi:GTP-binding protein
MTDPSPSSPSASSTGGDERAQAKRAMAWTHTARFLTTASRLSELPVSELPEIAFVGRSNAGKSTAINALTQQKRLAFASKTPGRTQHINLFELGPRLAADALFADLPGYGYAAVDRGKKLRWQQVMAEYLETRRNLAAIVLLLDSRLGFTEIDRNLLEFVAPRIGNGSVKLLVLLAKIDKLGRLQKDRAVAEATRTVEQAATDESDIAVATLSALNGAGVSDVAVYLRQCVPETTLPGAGPGSA